MLVAGTLVLTGGAGYAAGGSTFTWHLDETSGSTMVDSTGGQDGAIEHVQLGVPGHQGSAYRFDGSSSQVIVPNNDALNPYDADVHISLWIRTTTTPAVPDYDLFRKGEYPGSEYKMELQPNGQASCDFRGSVGGQIVGQSVQNGPDLSDGSWHNVQCDKTATTVSLTVDGSTTTKNKAVGSIANSFNTIVGAYPFGDFYQGDLDEITMTFGARNPSAPTASFTASPTSGAAPLSVAFKDTSAGSPTAWAWDFGDGATSASQNPSHVFQKAGTYAVKLTASNSAGATSASRTVTVSTGVVKPTASFTASPTSGAAPLSVAFKDTSAGSPTAWAWDFGDGATSASQNPSHVFQKAGTYAVKLTASNSAGATSESRTVTVSTGVVKPTASFTASPTSGAAPLSVAFKDTSAGSPTAWAWDFGDGATSASQNPSHVFQKAGTYAVKLTASNSAGATSESRTVTVSTGVVKPTASFTASPTSGAAPLSVAFKDTSAGSPTAWAWDFGDGATSASQNPSHVFQKAGTYAVKLTARNSAGATSANRTVTVTTAVVRDRTAPRVRLLVPRARHRVAAFRVLRGRVHDGQSGAARVLVKAVERRHGHWYAYQPARGRWVRAPHRAVALHRAGWMRIAPRGDRWSHRIGGLRRGMLVLRLTARDHAGNTARVRGYHFLLRHP